MSSIQHVLGELGRLAQSLGRHVQVAEGLADAFYLHSLQDIA